MKAVAIPPALTATTIIKMIDDNEKSAIRKLNHPFLTYLTIASLCLTSLLFLVGAVMEVVSYNFINMLYWGLDALFVTILSVVLTSWDLWSFVNLTKEEQQS